MKCPCSPDEWPVCGFCWRFKDKIEFATFWIIWLCEKVKEVD